MANLEGLISSNGAGVLGGITGFVLTTVLAAAVVGFKDLGPDAYFEMIGAAICGAESGYVLGRTLSSYTGRS